MVDIIIGLSFKLFVECGVIDFDNPNCLAYSGTGVVAVVFFEK